MSRIMALASTRSLAEPPGFIGEREIGDDHVELLDALVVDVAKPGTDGWMPLFVVLREGTELTDEVVAERNMELELDEAALDLIGAIGFDPVYGARPLKRAIQQQIENPLAQRILRNELVPGDRVRVSVRGSELVFDKIRQMRAVGS